MFMPGIQDLIDKDPSLRSLVPELNLISGKQNYEINIPEKTKQPEKAKPERKPNGQARVEIFKALADGVKTYGEYLKYGGKCVSGLFYKYKAIYENNPELINSAVSKPAKTKPVKESRPQNKTQTEAIQSDDKKNLVTEAVEVEFNEIWKLLNPDVRRFINVMHKYNKEPAQIILANIINSFID